MRSPPYEKKNKNKNIKERNTTMTKTLKRIVSLLITTIMIVTMGSTVFARTGSFDITIVKPTDDKAEHTYTAYQIFKGDVFENTLNGEKTLIRIEWGDHIDEANFLLELQNENPTAFGLCADAADVAQALDNYPAYAPDFANIATKHLKDKDTAEKAVAGSTDTEATINVTSEGYYLIVDEINQTNGNGAVSKHMLMVVDVHTADSATTPIQAKEDLPTMDKNIVDASGNKVKYNTANVGEVLTFQLDSSVPDVSEYKGYFFIVNDKLDDGFDYVGNLTVTVGGSAYTAYTADVNGNEIKINFIEAKTNFTGRHGDEIVITYQAKLNEKAVRTDAGNRNTVSLTYANDPNYNYQGSNEPALNEPTGKTPDVFTKTYTTDFSLIKIDSGTGKRLPDAEFQVTLSSTSTTQVIVETEEYALGTGSKVYYKLKDGSYTDTAPGGTIADDKYESTTDTYVLTTKTEIKNSTTGTTVTATVDSQGYLCFAGLGAGTYKLKETKAPVGYALPNDEYEITITSSPDLNSAHWTYQVGTNAASADKIELEIKNTMNTLPQTGGMGTTIFYVAGSVLLAAGVVLLITKKRLESNKQGEE